MAEETKTAENLDENLENVLEDNDSSTQNTNSSDNENINEGLSQFLEDKPVKQQSLLSKILIGTIGFLLLLIITGVVLYFLGFFDPEPQPEPIENQTTKEVEKKPQFNFSIKEINTKKLNEQLSLLTNKNLNQEKAEEQEKTKNEEKIIEEQKLKEQEELKAQEAALIKEKELLEAKKLELEQQKSELENLRQEAIAIKEDMQTDKKLLEENNVSENTEMPTESKPRISIENETTVSSNEFLLLINVAKIKGQLYKKYLDKVSKVSSNVKLCRDDKNRIEIYFGPFNNESDRKIVLDKLSKNKFTESYSVELTKEEFDKRCNY